MTKNIIRHDGSSNTPQNDNISLENLHNISEENFSANANSSEFKSPQQIAAKFAARSENLGYGFGNFLSKTPIGKTLQKLFGTKTNRALLQTSDTANLSDECREIIDSLDLDNTDKEFLLNITDNLVNDLSKSKKDQISDYLLSAPGGNLNDAAKVIYENFEEISEEQAKDFLTNFKENASNSVVLKNYIDECIGLNQNFTHSPTPHTPRPTPEGQDPIAVRNGTLIALSFCMLGLLIRFGIDYYKSRARATVVAEEAEVVGEVQLAVMTQEGKNPAGDSVTPLKVEQDEKNGTMAIHVKPTADVSEVINSTPILITSDSQKEIKPEEINNIKKKLTPSPSPTHSSNTTTFQLEMDGIVKEASSER